MGTREHMLRLRQLCMEPLERHVAALRLTEQCTFQRGIARAKPVQVGRCSALGLMRVSFSIDNSFSQSHLSEASARIEIRLNLI